MARILPVISGEQNEILRRVSVPIPQVTPEIEDLAEDMLLTVRAAKGIGLAAPQVGWNIRLIVAQISGKFLVMMHPQILKFSEATEIMEEGCLSLPGLWGKVERPREIVMSFTNLEGRPQTFHLQGIDARVVQHEIDHLDGILFIDRLKAPPYERSISDSEAQRA